MACASLVEGFIKCFGPALVHPSPRRITIATTASLFLLTISVPFAIVSAYQSGLSNCECGEPDKFHSILSRVYGGIALLFGVGAYIAWFFRCCLQAIKESHWTILFLVFSILCFLSCVIQTIEMIIQGSLNKRVVGDQIAGVVASLFAGLLFLAPFDFFLAVTENAELVHNDL